MKIGNDKPEKYDNSKFKNKKNKKYNYSENEFNYIEINEIETTVLPNQFTINSLIKYFEDCELGTIILPLYVYKAKKNKNDNDIQKLSKYYSNLYNAYLSLDNNNDNLISEYTNRYKKAFEYMMSKFSSLGYKSDLSKFKFNEKDNFDLFFNIPKIGNFKIPKSVFEKKEKKKYIR